MLVIERNHRPYIGWENLLLYHREFTNKLGKKRIRKIKENELRDDTIPKGYGFYQIIYYFHIFILVVSYSSLFIKTDKPSSSVVFFSLLTIVYFIYVMIKYNNNRLRKNLLYEKIIMEKVLVYIKHPKIVDQLKEKYPDKRSK
ncbi:MAG: hypothetical protein K9I94_04300 [Bacteroidales bacterium]|nr:hypothetical protein [Bacteroidales bacterium]